MRKRPYSKSGLIWLIWSTDVLNTKYTLAQKTFAPMFVLKIIFEVLLTCRDLSNKLCRNRVCKRRKKITDVEETSDRCECADANKRRRDIFITRRNLYWRFIRLPGY